MPFQFESSYLNLPDLFYDLVAPVPVATPELLVFNQSLASELGLGEIPEPSPLTDILVGNRVLSDNSMALAYAGHQFGHFSMLGDGRAVLLGEHVAPDGTRWDVQLKGSGKTMFSRRGDGRAALGPMLREYLVSESMHHLGIPTTRSLAVVSTGESVQRERVEKGAVLTRIAASHLRVGTFEYASATGRVEALKALADYAILRHCPQYFESDNPYLDLLGYVAEQQARLVVQWLCVGFIHGVMNTDNVAISGETIDYGPCAFMDQYDPATVFSYIDEQGRYSYGNQRYVTMWNLARFADTLLPLIDPDQETAISYAEHMLHGFSYYFDEIWIQMMGRKLGIHQAGHEDMPLIEGLLNWMEMNHADFTNTFRTLSNWDKEPHFGSNICSKVGAELADDEKLSEWIQQWQTRIASERDSYELMRSVNPARIPRNHWVNRALNLAESGDFELFHQLLGFLSAPYEEVQIGDEQWARFNVPPSEEEKVQFTFCGT